MSALLVLAALVIACISDIRTQTIPNSCVIAIVLVGIFAEDRQPFWLAVLSFGGIFLLLYLPDLILKRPALGGGDLKLAAAFAFYVGWMPTIIGLELAFLTAVLYRKICKKTETPFPFAPYLMVGFGVVLLFPIF